jgi:hypothetical protein
MPVMVLYQTREFPKEVLEGIANLLASVTHDQLDAKIELRALRTEYSFNANEIHIEMRFRDFGEWSSDQLTQYHETVMTQLSDVLRQHDFEGAFSFYILPSNPPRSLWAQAKIRKEVR